MSCNTMSYHSEHLAWQQRVNKELGEARRFNQVLEGASMPGTPPSMYKNEMASYYQPT